MMNKAILLQHLRREILSLGGIKSPVGEAIQKNGLELLQDHFPFGVFPVAAVHEFLSSDPEELAASTGFIAGLIHTCLPDDAVIVWINTAQTIFAPALTRFGISPDKIIFIHPATEKETNWCMEEALQCNSITAVVAEMSVLNFTNSRRFQLAVEKSKVTGFIIHTQPKQVQTTACVSRWQINALRSQLPGAMPGVGFPAWNVELQKIRNGQPGKWEIAWIHQQFSFVNRAAVIPAEEEQRKTG